MGHVRSRTWVGEYIFFRVSIKFLFFFYLWFHLYRYCLVYIPTLLFPFLPSSLFLFFSLRFRQSPLPPWEFDCSYSLLCYIAFARGHMETAENLTDSVLSLQVSEKMTSRSALRCAGRGPALTHPSTDPVPYCLTWVIAWHRTPTTRYLLLNLYIVR